MHAYPETLLPDARSQLADAVDYAVTDCAVTLDDFFALFASSDWARRIERGDRVVIHGISGVELAQGVLAADVSRKTMPATRANYRRTSSYWVGWILSYYQWHENCRFAEILQVLPASTVAQMYGTYHEAPEERFVETVTQIWREHFPETRLERIRRAFGCSQDQLAVRSGVGVDLIQCFEQRKKDINRAEVASVVRLARALGCDVENLLENDERTSENGAT